MNRLNIDEKFKTILSDEALKNPEFVKEYLQFSFNKRRPEKDTKLYINICKIYEHYPETIKEVLDNINKLGYYKDYFHILKHSARQVELTDYIYDSIINRISEDITNMRKKAKISTLGKYLPREKAKINLKINFIDRFNETMFPGQSQFTARRNYRKLKTEFNIYLGTLEAKLATKKYDEINFNKVSHLAFKNNLVVIKSHDQAANKLKEYMFNKLKTGSLTHFISCVLSHEYEEKEIENVWEFNRFLMDIPALNTNELIANSMCIIDLSKDTFTYKFEYFAIGLALLVDQFSMLDSKCKVIVAGHGPVNFENCKGITQKADYLMKLCGPVRDREILMDQYVEMANNYKGKNLIFVTGKNIGPIEEVLKDKKITLRQYIPSFGKYYVLYYNGNAIRKFCRENQKESADILETPQVRNISQVITESKELNDFRMPIYVIGFMFVLLTCLNMQLLF